MDASYPTSLLARVEALRPEAPSGGFDPAAATQAQAKADAFESKIKNALRNIG